ncbi:hypothetical protein L484_000924 [Morus notabilis]|uniref:Uncharacterized protein n=1 Tax=Morus notabilis TaxID=981085 RepID=W9RB73_9ROSA|nr:hypothetical protein L484_000924 [Morus notabilis]
MSFKYKIDKLQPHSSQKRAIASAIIIQDDIKVVGLHPHVLTGTVLRYAAKVVALRQNAASKLHALLQATLLLMVIAIADSRAVFLFPRLECQHPKSMADFIYRSLIPDQQKSNVLVTTATTTKGRNIGISPAPLFNSDRRRSFRSQVPTASFRVSDREESTTVGVVPRSTVTASSDLHQWRERVLEDRGGERLAEEKERRRESRGGEGSRRREREFHGDGGEDEEEREGKS